MTRIGVACGAFLVLAFTQQTIATSRPLRQVSPGCTFPDTTAFAGPIRVTDLSDGLASDGRGPYLPGRDGVIAGGQIGSGVSTAASLTIFQPRNAPRRHPRGFVVNLDHPVQGGTGRPLGMVTDTTGDGMGLMAQWGQVGDAARNLHGIRIGQTVKAAMMSVTFFIDGGRYLLQMGPVPNGHCHNGGVTLVSGRGTTAATIHRAAATKWVVDVPAGGVARLFDVTEGTNHAVDRGLYNFRLHYEIGD